MLVRRFAVRVDIVGREVGNGQQVNVDAVGNQAGAVSQNLTAGAQVGDIGNTQAVQLVSALVGQLAQLTGTEQPAGPQHSGGVGDVAKVPGSLQIPHTGCHLR